VEYHGLSRPACVEVDGRLVPLVDSEPEALALGGGAMWDGAKRVLAAITKSTSVHQAASVRIVKGCRPERQPRERRDPQRGSDAAPRATHSSVVGAGVR